MESVCVRNGWVMLWVRWDCGGRDLLKAADATRKERPAPAVEKVLVSEPKTEPIAYTIRIGEWEGRIYKWRDEPGFSGMWRVVDGGLYKNPFEAASHCLALRLAEVCVSGWLPDVDCFSLLLKEHYHFRREGHAGLPRDWTPEYKEES